MMIIHQLIGNSNTYKGDIVELVMVVIFDVKVELGKFTRSTKTCAFTNTTASWLV